MYKLSVVLISKNQEWNIARLIESVLRETANVPSCEVVLVDSASTDQTIEIAANYPITILRLNPDQRLTPAAGRYVGYKWSSGEQVLFFDGDMELCEGWLNQALDVMLTHPEIAVISGLVIDRPLSFQSQNTDPIETKPTKADLVVVSHGGGAAMYRRSILEQVGTFNPYLYSDEEPELCLRIRHAGYQIVRLQNPIVYHYTANYYAISTLFEKKRRKFFLGFGQNMHYLFGKPLFWSYIKERGWAFTPALIILLGVIFLIISLVNSEWMWFGLWTLAIIFLIAGISIRKHSFKRALYSLVGRLLTLEGTIHGLFLRKEYQTEYSTKYDIIRDIRNPSCRKDLGLWQSKSYRDIEIMEPKKSTNS